MSSTQSGEIPPPTGGQPRGFPLFTLGLMVGFLGVFLLVERTLDPDTPGSILASLVKSNVGIYSGEYWRLVTPIFIHLTPLHLIVNVMTLWFFGGLLERLIGGSRLLFIVLLSGVCGVLAGYCFHDYDSAGASGAVIGVTTSLLAWILRNRNSYPFVTGKDILVLVLWILVLILTGVTQQGVDNWAHLGGVVGGGLGSLILTPPAIPKASPISRTLALITILTLMGMAFHEGNAWTNLVVSGMKAMDRDDLRTGEGLLKRALERRPNSRMAHLAMARVLCLTGRGEPALEHVLIACQLDPENGQAFLLAAEICSDLGKADEGISLLEAQLEAGVSNAQVEELLGRLYLETDRPERAHDHLRRALRLDPFRYQYHLRLAECLRHLERMEEALGHLETYESGLRARLTLEPRNANLMIDLASLLLDWNRDLAEAKRLVDSALQLIPLDPRCSGLRGTILYQMGRREEALRTLEKAITLRPRRRDESTFRYVAALVSAQMGLADRAMVHLGRGIDLCPTHSLRPGAENAVEKLVGAAQLFQNR